jgi:hypothetical protein
MENPYQSPTSRPDDENPATAIARSMTAAKRRILYWMLVLAVASGLVFGWLGPENDPDLDRGASLVLGLLFLILLLRWCEYDRTELAMPRWRFFKFMMVFCPGWLIVMPFYLLSTRGPAKGALAIVKGVAFLGLWVAVTTGVYTSTVLLLDGTRFGL